MQEEAANWNEIAEGFTTNRKWLAHNFLNNILLIDKDKLRKTSHLQWQFEYQSHQNDEKAD